jgi:hypothetical protein
MRRAWLVIVICVMACASSVAQSLAEAARKEAERRRQLADQGVEAKVIEGHGRSRSTGAGVTTFRHESGTRDPSGQTREPRTRISASTYRRLLQKLDREIAECEERQFVLRRRADAEKWSVPRTGRSGVRSSTLTPREKLLQQAEELSSKIRSLRRQRTETYEEGKKAGYLPGELDGKGITP